jgi:hypothetical protein
MLTGKEIQMLQLKGKNWLSVMFHVRKNGMLRFTYMYLICLCVTLQFVVQIVMVHYLLIGSLPSLV